jgi:hypothetical protein
MRSLDDLHVGGIGQQHPHGNFQTPVGGVDDTDRAVALLWFADEPKGQAMKWVERVANANVCAVDAQRLKRAAELDKEREH